MYSLEMVTVTDFTEEIFAKMQNVEPEKLMEYCYSINESAAESAKNVKNGMKKLAKLLANVFEEDKEDFDFHTPLMIDLVVRNILKYLSTKDLCTCRQVCKLWDQEASSYFRQKQRIIFYPESIEKMETFTAFMKKAQEDNIENEEHPQQEKLEQEKRSPFSTYCFTAQFPTTQFPLYLMQSFVKTCGQYVKKLEIFYPDDGQLSSEDFKAFFLAGMPHLESIHFVNLPQTLTQTSFLTTSLPTNTRQYLAPQKHDKNNDNDKDNEYYQNIISTQKNEPSESLLQLSAVTHLRIDRTWKIETCWAQSFLQDLLKLMPNLTDYELWTWNSTTEDVHSEPYLISLSPENKQSLKILRPGSIGDNLGITIAALGLKLRKLYLPVLNRNVSARTIELLLESQQSSLEEFQVNCSTMQDSRLILFPRMNKLKSLHMIITYPWNNDYTVFTPPINYKAQFPQLKLLKLELAIYNDFGFISYFFPSTTGTVCPTLLELDISFSGFRDDKFIGCVATIFPNIKKLQLDGYGSKIFSSICLHMQSLEHLQLYLIYGFNVDDQMTGIPKDTCLKIRKKDKFSEFKLHEVQVNPSLCSLTKLLTLEIRQKDYQAKFWPDAQCITNITAYFALANMKHLRHLHIESVKFTDECQRNLAETLEDCWLDFT